MLFLVLAWFLLGVVSYTVGVSVLHWFQALRTQHRLGDYWLAATWLGLLTLANALLGLSLVTPLTPLSGGLLALALSLPALTTGRADLRLPALRAALLGRAAHWPALAGLLAVATGALLNRPIFIIDAGAYHIGSIEWLTQHGTVPGLALLNPTLGYSSAWFALVAPFNAGCAAGRAYTVANGFVYFLLLLQILLVTRRVWQSATQPVDWFLLAVSGLTWLLVTRFLGGLVFSPSPDIPVILGLPVLAWLLFLPEVPLAGTHPSAAGQEKLAPWVMALGLAGVKLNALPILGLSMLFLLAGKPPARRLVHAAALGGLLIWPGIVTRVVASGYPFFPSRALPLGLPWQYEGSHPAFTSSGIRAFAQWSGQPVPPGLDYPGRWIPHWIAHEPVAVTLIGLQVVTVVWALRRWRWWTPAMRWGGALAALGSLYVLTAAPSLRFLMGYPVIALGLVLTDVFSGGSAPTRSTADLATRQRRFPGLARYANGVGMGVVAGGLALGVAVAATRTTNTEQLIRQGIAAGRVTDGPDYAPGWLQPPRSRRIEYDDGLPRDTSVTRQQVHDVEVIVPHAMCWDLPLPCSPPYHKVGFRLRNPQRGLAGGFVRASPKP
ncbi:MAG: hypothetical protein SNJ49_06355 [Chloracidobacterium sp.]